MTQLNNTISKDLRLNLQRFLESSTLPETDRYLALLATARSVGSAPLAATAKEKLKALEVPAVEIEEASTSAAIVGMLNIYYRFRHMISEQQPEIADLYKSAGLRMTSLAKPALGKLRFEQLAFAVSVLNGCETCINAHEKVLRDGGVEADKIHDLARLAATVKGLEALERAAEDAA